MAGISLFALNSGSGSSGSNDSVKVSSQALTDTQKAQARNNIGAVALVEYDSSVTPEDGVLYYTVEE